ALGGGRSGRRADPDAARLLRLFDVAVADDVARGRRRAAVTEERVVEDAAVNEAAVDLHLHARQGGRPELSGEGAGQGLAHAAFPASAEIADAVIGRAVDGEDRDGGRDAVRRPEERAVAADRHDEVVALDQLLVAPVAEGALDPEVAKRRPRLLQRLDVIAVGGEDAPDGAIVALDELADALVLPLANVDLVRGLLVDDEDVFHRALPRRSSSLRIAVSVLRSAMRPSRHASSASASGTKRTSARSSTGVPSSVGVRA